MSGVLVIGAGPGIGTSVARRFGSEGLPVSVVARTNASLRYARAELHATGVCDVVTHSADAADPVQLRRAIGAVCRSRGTPEALIYNVGWIRADRAGELDHQAHLDAYATNVLGALNCAALVAPHMARSGSGTIIFTGGMPVPDPGYVSLSLGKAGLRALAALLDRQYRPQGLHVATVTVGGAVAPGSLFDPDCIAEQYWQLHIQRPDQWDTDVLLTAGRPEAVG
jgi:NAD(P)-dependent dehydrogenase (short-subunit alcohol dehydrogenase family)